MNRLVLLAEMVERGAARYTPAGLPVCEFSLKHESQVTEASQPRKVSMEIRAVGIGDIAKLLQRMDIGTRGSFAGFLTNQRNGRGIVFHVTEVEVCSGSDI
ncbi:primosomal replication protein N [Rhizobacter sp. Root1221]|uniref:primosomal replication protein N n=1 Tax=Rhizobacter sp. Root1221 TaxID=1736433 RepID=UPI0006FEC7CC|nr:primosomal replication protein N [Rhizobacter sp. Root1221]KQW02983.1 single-stranded DNA-binding protein [Rhizobacter sp. Root1221]